MRKQLSLILLVLCLFSFAPAYCTKPIIGKKPSVSSKEGVKFLKHVFKSYMEVYYGDSEEEEEKYYDEFMGYFDEYSKGSVDWELSMSAKPKSLPDLFYLTGHVFMKPKIRVSHVDKSLFIVCVKGVRSFACRLKKRSSGRITILSLKAL